MDSLGPCGPFGPMHTAVSSVASRFSLQPPVALSAIHIPRHIPLHPLPASLRNMHQYQLRAITLPPRYRRPNPQLRETLQAHITASLPPDLRQNPSTPSHVSLLSHVQVLVTHLRIDPSPLSVSAVASSLASLSALYAIAPKAVLPRLVHVPPLLATVARASPDKLRLVLRALPLIAAGIPDSVLSSDRLIHVLLPFLSAPAPSSSACLPSHHLAIVDYVALASAIRWPSAVHVPSPLLSHFTAPHAQHADAPPPLVALAVAAGLYTAFESSASRHTLLSYIAAVIGHHLHIFDNLSPAHAYPGLQPSHSTPVALLFLIAAVGPPLFHFLPTHTLPSIMSALQRLNITLCSLTHPTSHRIDPFFTDLQALFNTSAAYLAAVYTAVTLTLRAVNSATRTLHLMLASTHPANPSLNRFILTFATFATSHVGPMPNVAMLDMFSMLHPTALILQNRLSHLLVDAIAPDLPSMTALARITCAVLLVDLTQNQSTIIKRRASTLLRYTARVLSARAALSKRKRANLGYLSDSSENEHEVVWMLLAQGVIQLISSYPGDSLVTSCVDFATALIASDEACMYAGRQYVVKTVLPKLLQRHSSLHDGSPSQKDIMLSVRVMDSIVTNTGDAHLLSECVNNTVAVALDSGIGTVERVAYVCILRGMLRCDISMVNVVMNGLDKLVGSSTEKKKQFMGIARVAVLGAEMSRKNVCLQWLLKTFNGLGTSANNRAQGMQPENAVSSSRAKL